MTSLRYLSLLAIVLLSRPAIGLSQSPPGEVPITRQPPPKDVPTRHPIDDADLVPSWSYRYAEYFRLLRTWEELEKAIEAIEAERKKRKQERERRLLEQLELRDLPDSPFGPGVRTTMSRGLDRQGHTVDVVAGSKHRLFLTCVSPDAAISPLDPTKGPITPAAV